jgi:hypothetical protein
MQTIRRIPYYGSLLLLAYMPFHVFLSQSLSLLTGGLDEWKVAKDVLLAVLTVLTVSLVYYERKADRYFNLLFGLTVCYGILMLGVWAAHPHIYRSGAVLGFTYDIRLFCYVIVGYGAAKLTQIDARVILKLLLTVSTAVAFLGVLQYFLPSNLLAHFGYSIARGARPNFFIDSNPEFPRIMSTLRDPNSLGTYLVLPVGLLTSMILRARSWWRRAVFLGVLFLQGLAIYLTFSRSAWAATALVVSLIVWWQYRHWFMRTIRRYWPIVGLLIILLGVGGYTQRNNPVLTHRTNLQTGTRDSNQLHVFFAEKGIKGIEKEPLGHGPGTAGLVSIQNPHGGFLTENYYIQVGYESGIAGMVFFIALQGVLCVRLWPERHTYLGLILLASFWGYVLVNMVLQEWDNEAVAVQWWMVSGLAIGLYSSTSPHPQGISVRLLVRSAFSIQRSCSLDCYCYTEGSYIAPMGGIIMERSCAEDYVGVLW